MSIFRENQSTIHFIRPIDDGCLTLFNPLDRITSPSDNCWYDPHLSPELEADLNVTRHQFNTSQECEQMPANGDEEALQKYHDYLYQQIESQIREHALAQPLFISHALSLQDDGVHFSGQKSSKRFVEELIQTDHQNSIFTRLAPYFSNRFGCSVDRHTIVALSDNPELFTRLVSDRVWYKTKAGLELAEIVGLIRLEKVLKNLQHDEVVLDISAYSPLRPTPVPHNWIRLYQKRNSNIETIMIKTYHTEQEIKSLYCFFNPDSPSSPEVQDMVSTPLRLTGKYEEIMAFIGIPNPANIVYSYDAVLTNSKVIMQIHRLVGMIMEGQPIFVLDEEREKLENMAIIIHKEYIRKASNQGSLSSEEKEFLIDNERMYGKGGGCGVQETSIINEIILGGTESINQRNSHLIFGPPEHKDLWICSECGAKHRIINGVPSTYFSECQADDCDNSGKC